MIGGGVMIGGGWQGAYADADADTGSPGGSSLSRLTVLRRMPKRGGLALASSVEG